MRHQHNIKGDLYSVHIETDIQKKRATDIWRATWIPTFSNQAQSCKLENLNTVELRKKSIPGATTQRTHSNTHVTTHTHAQTLFSNLFTFKF